MVRSMAFFLFLIILAARMALMVKEGGCL